MYGECCTRNAVPEMLYSEMLHCRTLYRKLLYKRLLYRKIMYGKCGCVAIVGFHLVFPHLFCHASLHLFKTAV